MTILNITEKRINESNLRYVISSLSDFAKSAGCEFDISSLEQRSVLTVKCPEYFQEIIKTETLIKVAEVIVVNYKYNFFNKEVAASGLSKTFREILLVALIAADLDEDKKYCYEKIKDLDELAIDGIYNFRLKPLRKKWREISEYVPSAFFNSELKDFITFLLENRRRPVYVENGSVYDSHYRILKRTELLPDKDFSLLKELILSNCGEIHILGDLPKEEEKLIREYYCDKIVDRIGQFCEKR